MEPADSSSPNFVRDLIADEQAGGAGPIMTRFPPEPNGYLHIGHAKAICLNFGMAIEFGGVCNLRFDDTNPQAEEDRFVRAIQHDVKWLGFDWEQRLYFASNYFDQLYQWARLLVQDGKAYVDSLSPEQIREYRGNFYEPGRDSPHRTRSVEDSLALLDGMKRGDFDEGQHVLRAKIDMKHGNLNMRDPPLYRILKAEHHRTGDAWCIYPMYDFAHGLSDAIEGVTHSLCTLEFEDHRPLYDWLLDQLPVPSRPRQIEFGRLNLTFTVLSKRKLLQLVTDGHVGGWDDPRMPTLAGLRRRGYPAAAIRTFCERIGVSKRDGVVDVTMLEHAVREDLNDTSPRAMAVLDPIRMVITNYPEGDTEEFDAQNFPEQPERGLRKVPFSRVLYVDRNDFREQAPRKWHRLAPGKEVRLRYACLVTCNEVIKNDAGEVVELRCTWDPESRGGTSPDGRKVRGTIHWVCAQHALDAEVRLYDRLFMVENPLAGDGDFLDHINPDSLEVRGGCKVEPTLAGAAAGTRYQFERLGYFVVDDDAGERLVFNRTIGLRDSWAKLEKQLKQAPSGKAPAAKR